VTDRTAWLQERRGLIGASDSPSILGRGYRTAAQVWAEKCGYEDGDSNDDVKLRIGTIIQPALVEITRAVFSLPATAELENFVRRSAEVPYVGASLDAVAGQDENGRDIPLELKNVDGYNAREWSDDVPHGCPIGYVIQVSQQMFVTGASHGYVMGLIGGNRPVLRRIERNECFIGAMLRKLAWFWNLVETRTPPPYQDAEDQARVLASLYPKANGAAIPLDEVALRILNRRDALSIVQTEAETKLAECNNELKAILGTNTYGALPDGRWLSWNEVPGSTYTVNRKPHRRLLVHDKRPKNAPELLLEATELPALESDAEPVVVRPDYSERSMQCQESLLSIGGIVRHESDSGSAYFVLPGGMHVRVADHEPNEKTNAWIERHGVVEIRIDQDDWEHTLSSVVGVLSK
jgi:putative phage-type endonuclease